MAVHLLSTVCLFLFFSSICCLELKFKTANNLYGNTGAPIKSEKANELSKDIIPIYYKLEIRPGFEPSFRFLGTVNILISCKSKTDRIILHASNLDITYFNLQFADGKLNSPQIIRLENLTQDKLGLYLNGYLAEGLQYNLTFKFKSSLRDDKKGIFRSSYQDKENKTKWIAATNFYPNSTRMAFPCFDEPDFRATFQVTLVRSWNLVSLSNADLERREERGSSWVADHFLPTIPIPPHLLSFIIFDFTSLENQAVNGTKIRLWGTNEVLSQGSLLMNYAVKLFSSLKEYFQVNPILTKIDLVAFPHLNIVTTPNWGLILIDEKIFSTSVDIEEDATFRLVIQLAKKLSQQWFGGLVSLKVINDNWITEGISTYFAYNVSQQLLVSNNMEEKFYQDIIQLSITTDDISDMQSNIFFQEPEDKLFQININKASIIYRLLHKLLGSIKFQQLIQSILETKKFEAVPTTELWASLEKNIKTAENISISKLLTSLTTSKGISYIDVKRNFYSGRTTIYQKRINNSDNETSINLSYIKELPITYVTQSDPFWNNTKLTWIISNETKKTLGNIGSSEDEWIIFNMDRWGYFRVNYDRNNWDLLKRQLRKNHTIFSTITRTALLEDAFEFVRIGELHIETALDLTLYLSREFKYLPWSVALNNLFDIKNRLEDTEVAELVEKYIYHQLLPIYERLNGDEIENEPEDTRSLRKMVKMEICKQQNVKCLHDVKSQFQTWMNNPYLYRIKSNYRNFILRTAVREGGNQEWDFIAQLYRLPASITEEKGSLLALASTKDKINKERLLNFTLSEMVRNEHRLPVLLKVLKETKEGFKTTSQFLENNLKEITAIYPEKDEVVSRFLIEAAAVMSSEQRINYFHKFLEENSTIEFRNINDFKQVLTSVQTNRDWLKRHKERAILWFKENVPDILEDLPSFRVFA